MYLLGSVFVFLVKPRMSSFNKFLSVFQTGLKSTTVKCFVLKDPSNNQPPPFLIFSFKTKHSFSIVR